ncbi:MAG TPA: CsbD family protein [Acidimicrobiia bacterium]
MEHTDSDRQWHERLRDEGAWERVKGKIRAEWGDLTDQEVEQARGDLEQFVGRVKQMTGESVEAIMRKVEDWSS